MTQHERPAPLDQATLEALRALFFPRLDVHAEQWDNGQGYTYRPEPVTLALLEAHLWGEVTLGTYALSLENTAHWIVIDADQEAYWQQLLTLAATSALPLYLEQSRRGGHVWSFFAEPVPGKEARHFARALLQRAGFQAEQIQKIEIYPKQAKLVADKPGSLIRAPFGFHRRVKVVGQPGKRYGFQAPDGAALAPTIREQLALLAYAQRISPNIFQTMLNEVPDQPRRSIKPTPRFTAKPVDTKAPLSERIKGSISVFEFVSRYVELDAKNWGFCPFHDDQHKSFGVDDTRNFWSCQAGCGGGSVVNFWMLYRERVLGQDGSFKATIKDLAKILDLSRW